LSVETMAQDEKLADCVRGLLERSRGIIEKNHS
jgi:hypothetical protein